MMMCGAKSKSILTFTLTSFPNDAGVTTCRRFYCGRSVGGNNNDDDERASEQAGRESCSSVKLFYFSFSSSF